MTTTELRARADAGNGAAPPDAREASLRPFGRAGFWYWALFVVLAAVVVLGLVAWSVQLRRGLGAAGYSDDAFWAMDIANVVTFIGVSYGGAVISAILRLTGATWRAPLTRLAEGTAVVTVLVGGAFIIPHLGRPERIWELVAQPNFSSPIFWDFVAIGTYTIASIVFFALPLVPDMATLHRAHRHRLGRRSRVYAAISRGWVGAPRQRAVLRGALGLVAIMIIPLAVSVHSVLSWALALVSRPWWHESIWAPSFVVAALYSGVALVILVVAAFRRAYHLEAFITERHFVRLGFIMATFAAAYLYLTFADILPDAYVGEQAPSVVFRELLSGHFAPWFWTFVVGGGLLPLLLVAIRRTRNVTGMVIASALVVPAMWLKRMIMVVDPATYDRMTQQFGVYHFTWISVSITVAGVAAIPLLLMVLFRLVPLLSITEIEELEGHSAAGVDGAPARALAAGSLAASGVGTDATPAMPAAAHHGRKRSLIGWTAGVLVLVVAAVTLISAGPARADTGASPPATPPSIGLTGAQQADGVHLAAIVTDADRVPIVHATVQFFQSTTQFGPKGRLVPLGSAVTDRDGAAQLTYQPTVTGTQRFVVTFAADPKAAPTTATVDVAVTLASSAYRPAPPKPFADIGRILVGVLLVIVALVLLTLAVQVERVRRACRAGR